MARPAELGLLLLALDACAPLQDDPEAAQRLSRLKRLEIGFTRATEAGLAGLRRALPRCRIH